MKKRGIRIPSKLPPEALEALAELTHKLIPAVAQWRFPKSVLTLQFKANEDAVRVTLACLLNFSLEYGIMPHHALTEKQHETLKQIEADLNEHPK